MLFIDQSRNTFQLKYTAELPPSFQPNSAFSTITCPWHSTSPGATKRLYLYIQLKSVKPLHVSTLHFSVNWTGTSLPRGLVTGQAGAFQSVIFLCRRVFLYCSLVGADFNVSSAVGSCVLSSCMGDVV